MQNNKSMQESVNERIRLVKENRKRETRELITLSVIGVLGFIIIWQVLVIIGVLPSRYVPMPTQVLELFFIKWVDVNPDGGTLLQHIIASMQVTLTGFGIAILVGVPLGLFMGWFESCDKFFRPIFEILRPIPPVSWIPLTIIWMGVGLTAKAFIVFFSAFVPCVINAYTGIRQTNPVLINFSKTCGASNFTIFYKIGIPSSLTMVFAGIRVALGNAWATLVAAEMLASSVGLGYMIQQGRMFARPDIIILGIVVIGCLGVVLTFVLGKVENRLLGWKK